MERTDRMTTRQQGLQNCFFDISSLAKHLKHLEDTGLQYVCLLFIDFSSAFSTIQPYLDSEEYGVENMDLSSLNATQEYGG